MPFPELFRPDSIPLLDVKTGFTRMPTLATLFLEGAPNAGPTNTTTSFVLSTPGRARVSSSLTPRRYLNDQDLRNVVALLARLECAETSQLSRGT
jgi:hypothetical protein